MDEIQLKVNNQIYNGWDGVTLRRSLGAVAGAFGLSIVKAWEGGIYPQDVCKVTIGGETIISGYVDAVNMQISGTENGYSVEGRDFTGQLVDCSAIHKTGSWINAKINTIIGDLVAPFKIKAIFTGDLGEAFPRFTIQQSETVFEAIDRACKARGLIATSNFAGELIITDQKTKKSKDSLTVGVNIKAASLALKLDERFSKYTVKGSLTGDDFSASNSYNISASVVDKAINLYRPLIIIAEGQVNKKTAQARANIEASIRAAKASAVDVTVVGWRQSDGRLWDVNYEIPVNIPQFDLKENMLIIECAYSLDEGGGKIVNLKLMRDDAFLKIPEGAPKEVKKRKSGFKW